MNTDFDREATAVHEAGHAVMMINCRWTLRYVTLAARDGGGAADGTPFRRGALWTHVLGVYAAGMIAQHTIDDNRADIADGGHSDLAALRECARDVWRKADHDPGWAEQAGISGHTVREIAETAWAHAYDFVARHYGPILAVADALNRCTRAITGAQIRRISAAAPSIAMPDQEPHARTLWPAEHSRLHWTPARPRARRSTATP